MCVTVRAVATSPLVQRTPSMGWVGASFLHLLGCRDPEPEPEAPAGFLGCSFDPQAPEPSSWKEEVGAPSPGMGQP